MNKSPIRPFSRQGKPEWADPAGEKSGNVKYFLDKQDRRAYLSRYFSNGPAPRG
jgi:hypothetical protein